MDSRPDLRLIGGSRLRGEGQDDADRKRGRDVRTIRGPLVRASAPHRFADRAELRMGAAYPFRVRFFATLAVGFALFARPGAAVGARTPPTGDGVRPAYRDHLWRMTGRLAAADGRTFSYAATFFRYVEPHGVVLYPATVSVLDERSGRRFSQRRTERAGFGLGRAANDVLDVRVGTWRLRESFAKTARPAFDLDAKLEGLTLAVRGVARKPRFALRAGATEHDEYSSLASSGTIDVAGDRVALAGKSWLDCEYSNERSPSDGLVSQIRVQLDDGREIYVEASGSPTVPLQTRRAYLVERDGTADALGPRTYEFGGHPGSTWLSERTRTKYPVTWGLHVDDKTEFLSLEPVIYDQESVARGDGRSFWDGAVDIYDVTPGSQGLRLGTAFVLMHGYPAERKTP